MLNQKYKCDFIPVLAVLLLTVTVFAPTAGAQDDAALVSAGSLIDRDVYDNKDKLIGEIEDAVIRRSGKVKKLIIEFGGFLNIADRRVSLNFKRSRIEDQKVVIDIAQEELETYASFDYYRQGLRPGYYFRYGPYGVPYLHNPPPYPYEPDFRPGRESEPTQWAFSPPRFLATVIMGRYLINSDGEQLGQVEDLLIDVRSGTVKKIIVSSGGLLTGESRKALPYKTLGFSPYGLVYDVSAEDLEKLPAYVLPKGK